ncbi:MAG: 5-formyltetrahydrofolate cyclo-ligase [Hyphomonadaceae bacterium]|nr:5-formyltetrahydrofolate cyclo-ligase [Hyphomonadaceae bacterium]
MKAQKSALRAVLAARRDAAAEADAGERLMLPAALAPPPGNVVAGYVRFRSEIDPAPLMARLARDGCILALPRTPAGPREAGLTFHRWAPGEPLIRSAFGVLEPADGAPALEPDLLLVPLLGFDASGARLGYGAGHYDRTLAHLRARRSVTAIGLAHAVQEVAAVPTEPTDQRLDGILTPEGYRPAPAGERG